MFKKLKLKKEKRKEKTKTNKQKNLPELQKPNIEAKVYNNNKKCVRGKKKKNQKFN